MYVRCAIEISIHIALEVNLILLNAQTEHDSLYYKRIFSLVFTYYNGTKRMRKINQVQL